MDNLKYTWHVAYVYTKNTFGGQITGYGDIEIKTEQNITSRGHVDRVRDAIAVELGIASSAVTIQNIIMLDYPRDRK